MQREALAADAAAERHVPVDVQVELQGLRLLQALPAQAAVSRVRRSVRGQVTDPLEGLAANFAAKRQLGLAGRIGGTRRRPVQRWTLSPVSSGLQRPAASPQSPLSSVFDDSASGRPSLAASELPAGSKSLVGSETLQSSPPTSVLIRAAEKLSVSINRLF